MDGRRLTVSSVPAAKAKLSRLKLLRKNLWAYRAFYLMLLPGVVYYIVFRYVPMYGVIIAFKDFNMLEGIVGGGWADPWYKHFAAFFQSPYFAQLLTNTFLISIYKLVFGVVPPILMASLLNECRLKWLKTVVQTLTYMPHFLSWVIIYGILIAGLLSQTSGLVNRWLVESGADSVPFLTSTDYFRAILVGSEIWKDLGWGPSFIWRR
ncbi:hypothetical protein LJK88_27950 [Paenibacillus sp. P26]|nr:hypothetical protein LJK88_27950 [Paenibacillus sp. P26]